MNHFKNATKSLKQASVKADGAVMQSVTVATMLANELMKQIHNSRKHGAWRELLPESEGRTPAILREEDQDVWLVGTNEQAWEALPTYPWETMGCGQLPAP